MSAATVHGLRVLAASQPFGSYLQVTTTSCADKLEAQDRAAEFAADQEIMAGQALDASLEYTY